jgi:hypothetical protein
MIKHTVAFKLKHASGSPLESEFLTEGAKLAAIPGVTQFEITRQVSVKNPYSFGVSMVFADQAAYDGYNNHPAHVAFVRDRWVPEVESFLEADFAPL